MSARISHWRWAALRLVRRCSGPGVGAAGAGDGLGGGRGQGRVWARRWVRLGAAVAGAEHLYARQPQAACTRARRGRRGWRKRKEKKLDVARVNSCMMMQKLCLYMIWISLFINLYHVMLAKYYISIFTKKICVVIRPQYIHNKFVHQNPIDYWVIHLKGICVFSAFT